MKKTLLVTALSLLALPVHAASFDCGKAALPYEKAVCGDKALSEEDDRLAAAYKVATAGLSAPSKAAMVAGQKEWLAYMAKICDDRVVQQNVSEDEKDPKTLEQARVDCLSQEYADRSQDLEALNEQNAKLKGLRVYRVETFAAVYDTEEGNERYPVGKHSSHYEQLEGSGPEVATFNAFVQGLAVAGKSDFSTASSDTGDGVDITRVMDGVISLDNGSWMYGHGAAHGNPSSRSVHFLRVDGRELRAGDIFKGEAWKKALPRMVADALKAGEDKEMLESYNPNTELEKVVEPGALSPSHWTFKNEGLIVGFNPYEIAPYAAGMPEATVPWNKLKPYLAVSATSLLGLKL